MEERKIEVHLEGFSGDLYGEIVYVCPTEYFRPIQTFSSAEELRAQLERDAARVREDKR